MDGSFSLADQFTMVHQGGGNIAYLDGSSSTFDPPHGKRDDVEELEDLMAYELLVHVGSGSFKVGEYDDPEVPFGWVNRPY